MGYELTTILEDIDRTGRLWKRRKAELASFEAITTQPGVASHS